MGSDKSEENVVKIDKAALYKFFLIGAVFVILIMAFFLFTRDNAPANPNPGDGGGGGIQPTYEPATVDDDPVLGDANAAVTIIEFSDYQCPFCRKAYTENFALIKQNYIDTGKAKLVFRDFPLTNLHPQAMISAAAANCVAKEYGDEAYYEYHDEIFEQQNLLDSGSRTGAVTQTVTYGQVDLEKWAKDIGYDISSCMKDSNQFNSEINNDLQDGSASGVQGTPGYWIVSNKGSHFIGGAYPYSEFQTQIDALL